MIKPVALWNFIHECEEEDAEYIGRICLALAGKYDPSKFSRAARIHFQSIAKDNRDMDDRIEERKEADRKRKERKRLEFAASRGSVRHEWNPTEASPSADSACVRRNPAEHAESATSDGIQRNNAEQTDSTDSAPIHPSVHPSIRPSRIKESVREKDTHTPPDDGRNASDIIPNPVLPSADEQRAIAHNVNVPESYLAVFNAEIKDLGYQYMSRGNLVTVCRKNYGVALKSFYRMHRRDESERKAPGPQALAQPGYVPRMEEA